MLSIFNIIMEDMSSMKNFSFLFILSLFPIILGSCSRNQMYIVYLGEHRGDKALQEIEDTHHSYLLSVKETEELARDSLIYSYKHSIDGFAAMLTPDEASVLSELEEVVAVFPSNPRKYVQHTTRSWQFVGLEEEQRPLAVDNEAENLLIKAKYGRDIIVGHLDSGIWPESESFNDEGFGPIPESWKGVCQSGDSFNTSCCNRKLIGARYYSKAYEKHYGPINATIDIRSPRDLDGHGTHTASTAVGRIIPNVSFMSTSLGQGTASGGAPMARLATYKVCWAVPNSEKVKGNTCFEPDMLAAMDDAIADGVHVMTLSLGSSSPVGYKEDGIAVGAFHAVKNNIVVACSAGNSGPKAATLSNPAPWIITVGASSLDRRFFALVVLGNGMKIEGETVTTYKLKDRMYPLVYASQVEQPNVPKNLSGQCMPLSLSSEKAIGKIVFCLRGNGTRIGKGEEVKRAGGVGYILGNSPAQGEDVQSDAHVLPATAVGSTNAIRILEYINSTESPTAMIVPPKTQLHRKPAPFMASFTSRGPNVIDPNILKPDITAPGLNILAAWSGADAPTKLSEDLRRVKWNFLSGTSMSCPHVAATAVLIKAVHPTWSSAAIRSAIMTTASLRNNAKTMITDAAGNPADPFQFGSGHIWPSKAADPGLVYDASYTDYLLYLCSGKFKNFDKSFKCPKHLPETYDLNYPSLAIGKFQGTVTVNRTVTNAGGPNRMYTASVKHPMGYKVSLRPSKLEFDNVGEQRSFSITVEARKDVVNNGGNSTDKYSFGWYTWSDGIHSVRSPMVVSSV